MKVIEFFKNRTVLGITCIVVAFIICFVISPILSSTGNKTITIVRVDTDIKSGDEITKDKVSEIRVSASNQASSVINSSKDVIGKYATMDMIKGDNVLKEKISDTPYVENTYFADLDGTNRAISVTLKNFANGLSGKLKPGDIVSVIAPDYKQTGITLVPSDLQFVEVIAVTSDSGIDVDKDTEEEKELPSTVTLLVSDKQSLTLAELENAGTIHMSLVYRGSREKADEFLKAQRELNDKDKNVIQDNPTESEAAGNEETE